jgi:arginine-tRNA-protein transferase
LQPGAGAFNAEINGALCRAGFRRSHDVVYRPACSQCAACTPVRIPAGLFMPSRTQKKLARATVDYVFERRESRATPALYKLFRDYEAMRHGDSDMAHMSDLEFAAMLQEGHADTHLYTLLAPDGTLKGCVLADHVGDGISAVYSFFDTLEPRHSLGTVLILRLIEEANRRDWPYIYLGYWIAQSRKMAYKASFHPLQRLGPHGWVWMDGAPPPQQD